jgi:hypothetical protein
MQLSMCKCVLQYSWHQMFVRMGLPGVSRQVRCALAGAVLPARSYDAPSPASSHHLSAYSQAKDMSFCKCAPHKPSVPNCKLIADLIRMMYTCDGRQRSVVKRFESPLLQVQTPNTSMLISSNTVQIRRAAIRRHLSVSFMHDVEQEVKLKIWTFIYHERTNNITIQECFYIVNVGHIETMSVFVFSSKSCKLVALLERHLVCSVPLPRTCESATIKTLQTLSTNSILCCRWFHLLNDRCASICLHKELILDDKVVHVLLDYIVCNRHSTQQLLLYTKHASVIRSILNQYRGVLSTECCKCCSMGSLS